MINELIKKLEKNKSFENYFIVGAYYCEEERNFKKAKFYLEKAISINPDNPEVNHYWSLILFDESRFEKTKTEELDNLKIALKFALKAYRVKPELEDVFYMGTSPIKRKIAGLEG